MDRTLRASESATCVSSSFATIISPDVYSKTLIVTGDCAGSGFESNAAGVFDLDAAAQQSFTERDTLFGFDDGSRRAKLLVTQHDDAGHTWISSTLWPASAFRML